MKLFKSGIALFILLISFNLYALDVVKPDPGYYPSTDIGRPVANGYFYVGIKDLDPSILANQKQVTVRQESGAEVQIPQPVDLSAGGVPEYLGSPVTVLVDGVYSLKVFDSHDVQIYYIPESEASISGLIGEDHNSDGSHIVYESIADLRASSLTPFDGQVVKVTGYLAGTENRDWFFRWNALSTTTDDNGVHIKDTSTTTGRWIRIEDIPDVYASWFGAVGGPGTTDDTVAIQDALDYLETLESGNVLFHNERYLIDSADITIPPNCGLKGSLTAWKEEVSNDSLDAGASGILIINPLYTIDITGSNNTTIQGLTIIRKGFVQGEAAQGADFLGTAITSDNSVFGTSSSVIISVQILGFVQAIDLKEHHRFHMEKISGDNQGGIKFDTASDVLTIKDIHFWPFATRGTAGGLDRHNRSGSGIWLRGQVDIAQITDVFTYGYLKGIYVEGNFSVSAATFENCHNDNTKLNIGSKGFHIFEDVTYTTFTDCTSFGNYQGFTMDADATDTVTFVNCRSIANIEDGFRINSGIANMIGCLTDTSVNGIRVANALSEVNVDRSVFQSNSTAHIVADIGTVVKVGDNQYNVISNIGGWETKRLASADPLTLPQSHDFITITGTTSFGTLNGGWPGRRVLFTFSDILTVSDGASMNLSGNFVVKSGDTLDLIYAGTEWREVSRSSN